MIVALKASELPPSHATDGCRMCGHRAGYLGRFIKANGAVSVRWVCGRCEDYRTAGDLPHSICDPIPPEALPLRDDRSNEPSLMPGCAVCDRQAQEYHHWAPVAIFPDWPDAGVYLCQAHHREWHARMRANGLRWPHELSAA